MVAYACNICPVESETGGSPQILSQRGLGSEFQASECSHLNKAAETKLKPDLLFKWFSDK